MSSMVCRDDLSSFKQASHEIVRSKATQMTSLERCVDAAGGTLQGIRLLLAMFLPLHVRFWVKKKEHIQGQEPGSRVDCQSMQALWWSPFAVIPSTKQVPSRIHATSSM